MKNSKTKKTIIGLGIGVLLAGTGMTTDYYVVERDFGRQLKNMTKYEYAQTVPKMIEEIRGWDSKERTLNEVIAIEDIINKECEGKKTIRGEITREKIISLMQGNCK